MMAIHTFLNPAAGSYGITIWILGSQYYTRMSGWNGSLQGRLAAAIAELAHTRMADRTLIAATRLDHVNEAALRTLAPADFAFTQSLYLVGRDLNRRTTDQMRITAKIADTSPVIVIPNRIVLRAFTGKRYPPFKVVDI
jgi:hypothetical protein